MYVIRASTCQNVQIKENEEKKNEIGKWVTQRSVWLSGILIQIIIKIRTVLSARPEPATFRAMKSKMRNQIKLRSNV